MQAPTLHQHIILLYLFQVSQCACTRCRPPRRSTHKSDLSINESVDAGLAGSVLEAKLNRTDVPKFYCSKEHDWEVEWLSLKAASRPDCLLDELTIQYDPATKRYAKLPAGTAVFLHVCYEKHSTADSWASNSSIVLTLYATCAVTITSQGSRFAHLTLVDWGASTP